MKIMDEKEKYEKVWRDCARYGKNWSDPGLGRPYKRPFMQKVPRGSTVIDFGCGNGSSLSWLKTEGMLPKGIEIADNAVMENSNLITIGDLRNAETVSTIGNARFGLCTDLMEHIPTNDVPDVLNNISFVVLGSVLFGIARLPDKDGDELGLQLHLTIQGKEWWDEKLLEHFSSVEPVRYDDGVYIVWGNK